MNLDRGTKRVRRGLFERLQGWEAAYVSRLSDGQRKAYGRGPTAEEAERNAERNWRRKYGKPKGAIIQSAAALTDSSSVAAG